MIRNFLWRKTHGNSLSAKKNAQTSLRPLLLLSLLLRDWNRFSLSCWETESLHTRYSRYTCVAWKLSSELWVSLLTFKHPSHPFQVQPLGHFASKYPPYPFQPRPGIHLFASKKRERWGWVGSIFAELHPKSNSGAERCCSETCQRLCTPNTQQVSEITADTLGLWQIGEHYDVTALDWGWEAQFLVLNHLRLRVRCQKMCMNVSLYCWSKQSTLCLWLKRVKVWVKSFIHTGALACMHACTHTQIYKHAYTHTHARTYTEIPVHTTPDTKYKYLSTELHWVKGTWLLKYFTSD